MRQSSKSNKRQDSNDDRKPIGLGIYLERESKWSNIRNNNYTTSIFPNIQSTHTETYQESLSQHRRLFDDGPLMRCLDKGEDEQRARDALFNTLLTDVQQDALDNQSYRGVVQIRSFWEDVRKHLRIEDGDISTPRRDDRSTQSQNKQKIF